LLETKLNEQKRTISYIIRHKDNFIIDPTYQREKVWPRSLKQYLIDTILRGLDIGRIFVKVGDDDKFYIVDGQQRLNAIWEFAENKFPLSPLYSDDLGGKYYRDLPRELRDKFDEYNVTIVFMHGLSDEEIRDIYRRINSGIPLNTAEKLNALPGDIVLTMRKVAAHPFLQKVCMLSRKKRYRAYHVAAQLMLLETKGISDVSSTSLLKFFDQNRALTENSRPIKKLFKTLDFLYEAFGEPTPELKKPSWIITIYLLASYLIDNYAIKGREGEFKEFVLDFYKRVKESPRLGDEELIRFNMAAIRGTTSEANVRYRHEVILRNLLLHFGDLIPKDPKREFTEEERIAAFRKAGGRCEKCGRKLSIDNFHVHHRIPHSEGGKTTLENAMVLCPDCHREIHSRRSA